ncbi:MAG: hypothetical protein JXX28_07435 [Deltaproteobacteria bacterium]|nr:hypothetical protein [Deltaproteobacteria bacterium]
MEITNRSIVLLVALIVVLGLGATLLGYLLTLDRGPRSDTPQLDRHVDLMPTVFRRGGARLETRGPVEVRLSKGSNQGTISLTCDSHRSERPFIDGLAFFDSIPLGDCSLTFSSQDDAFGPVLPGDKLVCHTKDYITHCAGSLADAHPASLDVSSELPGVLFVDGEEIGPLPLKALHQRMGTHELMVVTEEGVTLHWPLKVNADEGVEVHFPSPP